MEETSSFSPRLLGIAFWQAWWMIISRTGLVVSYQGDSELTFGWISPSTLLTLVTTLGYFAVAFYSYRTRKPLGEKPAVLAISALSASLGTLFLAALNGASASLVTELSFVIAICLAAIGNAMILCLWGELWATLETSRIGMHLFLSYLLAFGIFFAAQFMLDFAVIALACLMPVAAMLTLRAAYRVPRRVARAQNYSWSSGMVVKIVITLSVIGVAHGFIQKILTLSGSPVHSGSLSLAIDAIMLVCLFSYITIRRPEYEARSLFKAVTFSISAGVALIVAMPATQAGIGNGVFLFGIHSLDMLIMLVASDLAFRSQKPVVAFFAASLFVERAGTSIATITTEGLFSAGLITQKLSNDIICVLLIAAIAVGFVLFSEYDFMRLFQPASAVGALDGQALPTKSTKEDCLKISTHYGLTLRETEVLTLLAQGRSGPYIAENLVISPNTVRNHISNIYRKVGVYDRQSLLDIVITPSND